MYNHIIHICLISDSQYSKYMGATISSILKNSQDIDNIVFHIIDTGIFEDDKNRLMQLKEIKDFEINFYKYDHSKYIEICKEKLKHKVHVTPSAFCKLEIHNIDKKFKEYFEQVEVLTFLDQDAFNSVCRYNVKYIDDKYNFQLSNAHYDNIFNIKDIVVLHYVGSGSKPWENICPKTYSIEEYWKYFCLTPWFKENPGEYIETMIQQRFNNLDIENKFNIENERLIKLESENKILSDKINKLINTLAWWIPFKKWRDNFRKKVLADQTRPDQTRPDQT